MPATSQERQKVKLLIEENLRTKNPYLDLGNCGLDGSEMELELLAKCTHLETLILSNEWWEAVADYQHWSLKKSQNKGEQNLIKNIPQYISKNIRKLIIAGDEKDNFEVNNIGIIQQFGKLEYLDLSNNTIKDYNFLDKLTNLNALHIENNGLSEIGFLNNITTNLKYLNIENNHIQDISVLERFTSLVSINLSENEIIDISVLEKLEKLEALDLNYSKYIVDFSALGSLHQLRNLYLSDCKIEDYSFLNNLKNLQFLYLPQNNLSDIDFLKTLQEITLLELNYNNITNIDVLSNLLNLEELILYNNQISDISPLKSLQNILFLRLDSNQISDISLEFLNSLPKLKELILQGNPIQNIPQEIFDKEENCLEGLKKYLSENQEQTIFGSTLEDAQKIIQEAKEKKLKKIDLGNLGITDLSVLPELFELNELEVLQLSEYYYDWEINEFVKTQNIGEKKNTISRIPAKISNLRRLRSLYCRNIGLIDVMFLNNLKSLQIIDIANNPIHQTLNSLSKQITLSSVVSLYLGNCKIKTIEGLKINKQLKKLDLSENEIDDFASLKDYIELEKINLKGNQISDISFLNDLTSLQWLDLSINKIQDISFLQPLNQLQSLRLSANQIQDISFLQYLNQLQTLDLSINQIQDISYLQQLIQLQTLDLSNNHIQDITFLKELILLQALSLNDNQIQNITNLQYLTELQWLNLSRNQIQDISFLQHLSQLQKLYLSGNQIQDISFLQDIKQLQRLDLSDNQIQDISLDFLNSLSKLEVLELYGNPIQIISKEFFDKEGNCLEDLNEYFKNLSKNNVKADNLSYQGPYSAVQLSEGKIKQEALLEAFLKEGHTEAEAKTFIDFMISTELCFCLEQKDYKKLENPTFIFPQYLPLSHAVQDDWEAENNLHYCYQPAFFHKGLIERFLVRLGRLSEKIAIWRQGIRIFYPNNPETKALISFDKDKKRVYIQSKGKDKSIFISKIIQELDKLLDENSQSKPSENVTHWLALDGKGFVDKKKLLTAIEDEAKYVRDENGEKVLTAELAALYIEGFKSIQSSSRESEEKQEKTLKEQADGIKLPAEKEVQSPSAKLLRKIARLENYIEETEALIDDWEKKKRLAENPSERLRAEGEIQKLKGIITGYEGELESLEENPKSNKINENTMKEIFKQRFQEATEVEIPELLEILQSHYEEIPSHQRGSYNQLKQEFFNQPNNFTLNGWKAKFLVLMSQFKFEIPIPELPKISNTMQTPKQAPAIFTAFADSEGDLKNLNSEQKDIQNSFLNLDSQDKFKYIVSIETSLDNYFKFLGSYQNRIAIFHYGGHAGSTGITLQDGHLSFEHLAEELVDRNKNSLVFVFLNGCATKAHVETLFNLCVPLVLATAVPIADDTATIFAQKFYENLTNNSDSISMAYKSASRYIKAKDTQINVSRLGQVSRMSDVIQGVSTQNEAFPWGLYVREEGKGVEEMKLSNFIGSNDGNVRGSTQITKQNIKDFRALLFQKLEKGFEATTEVFMEIEKCSFQYNRGALADLKTQATQTLTQLAPVGFIVALKNFILTID